MSNESISVIDQEGSMAQLLSSAERELSAFVAAVNQVFGAEQGRKAAKNWTEELVRMDWPSEASVIDWRKVTIAAAARLVRRGKGQVSRTAMALQALSKQGAPHGSRAILRERKLRSNAEQVVTVNSPAVGTGVTKRRLATLGGAFEAAIEIGF